MLNKLFKVKDISLALGSGSAKGIAHIGVIEALEAAGYNIKAVSGTSMGAIVGAYYAFGKLDILKDWFLAFDRKETFKTIDFSVTGGFISGNRVMKRIEEQLGDVNFEDANVPLFIPATNLDIGREEVFYQGPVLPAIRASISVPGILKPYLYKGYYYVDGAVTDPVPVDILSDNGFKNIIAVHLHEYLEEREKGDAPGVIDTMARSMSIVSRYLAKSKMCGASVAIQPNLSEIGMFHVYKAKDIIDIGRKTTEEMIANKKLKPNFTCFTKIWDFVK